MKTIFLHELKQGRRSVIIWSISLIAAAALYLSIFPAFADSAEAINKMIMNFPEGVRKALGITFDAYSSLASFYAMILGYISLAGAIQAMNVGTGILSKEERGKTAEFLMTKPVKRSTILTAKLSASAVMILITAFTFIAASLLIMNSVSEVSMDIGLYMKLSMTYVLIQIFFLALGFLISVIRKRVKSVLSVSLVTVFGFYIVGMLDAVLGVENVRYFTPFKYYDLMYLIKNNTYEWTFVVLEAALVVAAIIISYVIFGKKDIQSI
jgi:ABC-2 type transport system permease protein